MIRLAVTGPKIHINVEPEGKIDTETLHTETHDWTKVLLRLVNDDNLNYTSMYAQVASYGYVSKTRTFTIIRLYFEPFRSTD